MLATNMATVLLNSTYIYLYQFFADFPIINGLNDKNFSSFRIHQDPEDEPDLRGQELINSLQTLTDSRTSK